MGMSRKNASFIDLSTPSHSGQYFTDSLSGDARLEHAHGRRRGEGLLAVRHEALDGADVLALHLVVEHI